MTSRLGHLTFKSDDEAIEFAEIFLKDRIKSLKYDVKRCLKKDSKGYSPFPALMYCLSVVDLMGSLLSGEVNKGSTTKNSTKYAIKYMKCYPSVAKVIWQQFRHKMFHLAMPNTGFKFRRKIVTWNLHDSDPKNHLMVIPPSRKIIDIGKEIGKGEGSISVKGEFVINIKSLEESIESSIFGSNGYIVDLKSKPRLIKKFKKAINEIYEVK
ncbi:MAG: hypothetical protein ACR2F1_13965 [Nitrososphaeraceae archaeon]